MNVGDVCVCVLEIIDFIRDIVFPFSEGNRIYLPTEGGNGGGSPPGPPLSRNAN